MRINPAKLCVIMIAEVSLEKVCSEEFLAKKNQREQKVTGSIEISRDQRTKEIAEQKKNFLTFTPWNPT